MPVLIQKKRKIKTQRHSRPDRESIQKKNHSYRFPFTRERQEEFMTIGRKYHISVIGTGFIARGLMYALKYRPQIHLSAVLSRRPKSTILDVPVPKRLITDDINKVIKNSDLVVECSGDAIHGTEMAEAVL